MHWVGASQGVCYSFYPVPCPKREASWMLLFFSVVSVSLYFVNMMMLLNGSFSNVFSSSLSVCLLLTYCERELVSSQRHLIKRCYVRVCSDVVRLDAAH